MELWDTAHGTRVLLEVLLGEGYEQDLRDLGFAAEAVGADVHDVSSCPPYADSETPSVERELLRAQHRLALRLGEAVSRVLDTQIADTIVQAKAEW